MISHSKAAANIAGVLIGGMIAILSFADVYACALCQVRYHLYNDVRSVQGTTLTQECPGGGHSAPFGNWGVDSGSSGSRENGLQFVGWKWESPWFQWNSCTSRQDEFPFGNSTYYNVHTVTDGPYSAQVSEGINQFSTVLQTQVYNVNCPSEGPFGTERGCEDVDGFVISKDVIMSLYEMDGSPLPGDDFVTSLSYTGLKDLRVRLDCVWDGCGTDFSFVDWSGVSNNGVTAFATIFVFTSGLVESNCEQGGPGEEF